MQRLFLKISATLRNLHLNSIPVVMMLVAFNQSAIIQWLPNSEPDLAGYIVHYGTASRAYSYASDVGQATSYIVENLQPGHEYFFAVTAYDTAGNESYYSEEVSIYFSDEGDIINLEGSENFYNFPNPFDPEDEYTQIRYVLKKTESVTIVIFDVSGHKIRFLVNDILKTPGEHVEDVWDGRDDNGNFVANGVYYAHLKSESLNQYITIAVSR